MTRSTPFSARCRAVLRPRPRLAPLTSANLGCVAMRDFPSSICGALRVPNDTIRYTVLKHRDAGGGWPAEGIVCPGVGDPCRTVWVRFLIDQPRPTRRGRAARPVAVRNPVSDSVRIARL